MAYRGGNIDITVKGDSTWDLDANNFMVLIYPDRHPETVTKVLKSEMTSVGVNHFSGSIPFTATKDMPLGYYTIEVLIFEDAKSRGVFAQQGAFALYDSASKDIED